MLATLRRKWASCIQSGLVVEQPTLPVLIASRRN